MRQTCKGILLAAMWIHTLLLYYIWNGLLSECEKDFFFYFLFFFQKNLTSLNLPWTYTTPLKYFTLRKYLNNKKIYPINKRFNRNKSTFIIFFPFWNKNTQIWDVHVQLIARQQDKMDSKDNVISSAFNWTTVLGIGWHALLAQLGLTHG